MKNIISLSISAIFMAVAIVVGPQVTFALAVADNGSGASTVSSSPSPAPSTQANGSGASSTYVPATQDNGSGSSSTNVPATQDNGSGSSSTDVPTTQDNGSGSSSVYVPATQDNGSGASVTTGSGNSGDNTGGSSGGVGYVSGGGGGYILPAACIPVTVYMKVGSVGPEVTKLQNFLNAHEAAKIAVTGTFTSETKKAVEAYQAKYATEILAPWGISTPTGYVYITTTKKINSQLCGTPLTLTPAELALLNAGKFQVSAGTPASEVVGTRTGTEVSGVVGSSTGTPAIAKDVSTTDDSQVAAVAKVSIWTKIWNFIKRIFGR